LVLRTQERQKHQQHRQIQAGRPDPLHLVFLEDQLVLLLQESLIVLLFQVLQWDLWPLPDQLIRDYHCLRAIQRDLVLLMLQLVQYLLMNPDRRPHLFFQVVQLFQFHLFFQQLQCYPVFLSFQAGL